MGGSIRQAKCDSKDLRSSDLDPRTGSATDSRHDIPAGVGGCIDHHGDIGGDFCRRAERKVLLMEIIPTTRRGRMMLKGILAMVW